MIGLGAMTAKADTSLLTTEDGWTKITTMPTATDIANNYYVFVDATHDLMLGIGKGEHQATKWYSLGVYYYTSVAPTSIDINTMVWTLETQGSNFAMRNLDHNYLVMQTEGAGAWMFDTNDVPSPNVWAEIVLSYSDGTWTIQNGKYGGNNYLGPWDDGNFTNRAECAANKSGANIGKFHIYAISRTQFKQNLLDNASASNPVDLTPWYVTNATFDANNITGWTAEGSGNNFNYNMTGCEIWHRSNFKLYQTLIVPNGKFKVSIQATGSTSGTVYGTSGSTTETASATVGNQDNFKNSVLKMIEDRNYGRITTNEITVSNGLLTIGFKDETADQWDVFDNFKLYCTGVDLSAYQAQLAALVNDCNSFIESDVVPTACETVISDAVSTYNTTYSTAKEYSTAIVALTSVLDTYRNDTQLQAAYAAYKSMRSNIQGLEDSDVYKYTDTDGTKNTLDAAINDANTAVEAATDASTIDTQTSAIRAAALTFISSVTAEDGNPFNLTFLASTAAADWQTASGLNPAATAPAWSVPKPDASMADFVESYTEAAGGESITGNILYQTLSGMPAGYYTVALYAAASYTPGRGSLTEKCTDGQPNITYGFAGNNSLSLPVVHRTSLTAADQVPVNLSVQLTSTGELTYGIKKTAAGSNWHVAQIYTITYSKDPDLTILKADRDALVSEAEGLLASSDASMLTTEQKDALSSAISTAEAANTFEALTEVTMNTLPNAIQAARQQIQTVKTNRVLMIAALERFENDYNLADGTDYRRVTMSAEAWTTLLEKVNAVSTALDDVSQASAYGTIKDALVSQMDATDQSLRLFKSYKAMVEGTTALNISEGTTYAADSYMDTDATEQTAITALNKEFDTYANAQSADFSAAAFLGENLDFSAAHGDMIAGKGNGIDDGNYGIFDIAGWEESYSNYKENYYIQTANNAHNGQLYIRSNWEDTKPTLKVQKERMLPVGKYSLSLKWNSNLANMTNLSAYVVDNTSTAIGKAPSGDETGDETLTYAFEVTDAAKPFDLIIGFNRTSTGNAAAQIIVDDITLTYLKPTVSLADATDNSQAIAGHAGLTFDVTLQGRTLFKDGAWNTLCLPFDMTAEQVTALLNGNGTLMELDTEDGGYEHATGLDGSTLYLNFKEATTITAGTPYIIKWADGQDLVNPTFTGVTIVNTTAGEVKSTDETVAFIGTFDPVGLPNGDKTNLFMDANNTLCWPNEDDYKVNAFRAYFKLSSTNSARQFVLNFGDDTTTGIDGASLNNKEQRIKNQYFDLSGRKLDGRPSRPGIYMRNGQKVIIK